jgi:hypothetical protein
VRINSSEGARVNKLRRYRTFCDIVEREHRRFVSRKVQAGISSAGLGSKFGEKKNI